MARKPVPREAYTDTTFGEYEKATTGELPLPFVLVSTALVENYLMTLLEASLIKGTTTDEMFKGEGQLNSLSKCYRMAYCLGLIPDDVRKNLEKIGGVRNRFAHATSLIDFADAEVQKLCKEMTLPKFDLPGFVTEGLDSRDPSVHCRAKFRAVCGTMIMYVLAVAQAINRRKPLEHGFAWNIVQRSYSNLESLRSETEEA